MRKAVAIATRGRRGIPLHWNERCQNKHYNNRVDDRTLARRICNSMARAKRKHQLCSFKGDWEDFTPVIIKKAYLD